MVFFLILLSLCSLWWFIESSCVIPVDNEEVFAALIVTLFFTYLAGTMNT